MVEVVVPHPKMVIALSRNRGLSLRQEAPVVLCRHLGCVLGGLIGLLVLTVLLENLSGQHLADTARSMGQQPAYGAAAGIRLLNAVSLHSQAPGLIESALIVGRVSTGPLDRFHEPGAGIGSIGDQLGAMPIKLANNHVLKPGQVRHEALKSTLWL